MKKQELTYEQAIERLEKIASSLEQQQTSLDDLIDNLQEAKKLLTFCKEKLKRTEMDVENILSEDGTR